MPHLLEIVAIFDDQIKVVAINIFLSIIYVLGVKLVNMLNFKTI